VTAVRPRPAWAAYFEELLVRHGAGDESWTREGRNLERKVDPRSGCLGWLSISIRELRQDGRAWPNCGYPERPPGHLRWR
jgi:hypothetical protein